MTEVQPEQTQETLLQKERRLYETIKLPGIGFVSSKHPLYPEWVEVDTELRRITDEIADEIDSFIVEPMEDTFDIWFFGKRPLTPEHITKLLSIGYLKVYDKEKLVGENI